MKKHIPLLSILLTGLILTGCGSDPYAKKEEVVIKEAPQAQQETQTSDTTENAVVEAPALEVPTPEKDEVIVDSVTSLEISNPELFQ